MGKSPRVLMVCLGNICRSPLAEGILRAKLNNPDIEVQSAGTCGWHIGEKPHPQSIKVALKYGIKIGHQRGRKLLQSDLDYFTHIYAMDFSNYNNILDLCSNDFQKSKVHMILQNGGQVPDPYGKSDKEFEKTYELIDTACGVIANQLT
ncbi:MAG: low molecular weight phosphotyrosine protein phosphatase [Flavobacteriaceae bacterium]|nr:low molecular weight phosphotyrosine protein phosphatase [Flavobacteriaceae bacterium]